VRDERSRYVLELRALEGAQTETVRRCFEGLFERAGLPQAIRSDNGVPFASVHGLFGLSRLSAWWVALGIDLERGRPGYPQNNGAHERLHGDISREIEALGHTDQAAFDVWRQSFNYERPHEALGMRCPGEVYRASERKYQGTPEDLDYPQMCSRRVSAKGTIKLDGQTLFLSSALAGWSVGLKPITEQRMQVWFGQLLLGEVDLATESFVRADIRPNKTAQIRAKPSAKRSIFSKPSSIARSDKKCERSIDKLERPNAVPHPDSRWRGAKGFYTIGILEEIEAVTKQTLSGCFDLIFGTSTGAIIAALLARGEPMAKVKKLYEAHVPCIMGCWNATQRSDALRRVADEVFGSDRFDIFKTNVGIVAARWKDERPMIFKTSVEQAHGSKDSFQPGFGCTVADAIVASCSAYPFFKRPEIKTGKGDVVEVADGGFCANNPTLYAIADATRVLRQPYESLRVISLGVGSYPEPTNWRRWLKIFPTVPFIQKILGTNTCSMETLRFILFSNVQTVRINETFNEPELATIFWKTISKN
jgi:patatin-like phospholipase/integrase-like protein